MTENVFSCLGVYIIIPVHRVVYVGMRASTGPINNLNHESPPFRPIAPLFIYSFVFVRVDGKFKPHFHQSDAAV